MAAYNKGILTTYLAGLRTTMTELLNAIRHDMNALNSTENIKEETIETVSPEQFVRSARTWLALNEKRMAAVQGVDGDQTQEQIKSDLVRLQAEIASAAGDYEKKLSETGGRNALTVVALPRIPRFRPRFSSTESPTVITVMSPAVPKAVPMTALLYRLRSLETCLMDIRIRSAILMNLYSSTLSGISYHDSRYLLAF